MALAVFYDTETTGLPRADLPLNHPDQPHLVQVAALLADLDTRAVISTLDVMVRPDDWDIPAEATAIHGITQEQATDAGVLEDCAVEMLLDLCLGKLRVGHNEAFDSMMISIVRSRWNHMYVAEDWRETRSFCTMTAAKPVMRLPASQRMINAGFGNEFKPPRLSEAYSFFCSLPMTGAHNAKMDARATMEVFFALQDRGLAVWK